MRVALTGATGFIGKHALDALLAAGHQVHALLRPDRRTPLEQRGLTWERGDLLDEPAVRRLVAGVDAIVHIAGAVGGHRLEDFIRTNVAGTRVLAEAAAGLRPGAHVLFISSLAAREPRLSWYASSKREGEECLVTRVRPWTIVRPPAVYGPDDPVLAGFWKMLARGWLVRVGPVRGRFSLVHVADLAESVVRLLEHGPVQRILTLDDGRPHGWSWSGLAALAADVRGGPVRTLPVPLGALALAARMNLTLARLSRRPAVLLPGKVRELAHADWVCDNSALRAALNWQPATRLEDSLTSLPGWNSTK